MGAFCKPVSGDGCAGCIGNYCDGPSCYIEPGWQCDNGLNGEGPSVCNPICGDGYCIITNDVNELQSCLSDCVGV